MDCLGPACPVPVEGPAMKAGLAMPAIFCHRVGQQVTGGVQITAQVLLFGSDGVKPPDADCDAAQYHLIHQARNGEPQGKLPILSRGKVFGKYAHQYQ